MEGEGIRRSPALLASGHGAVMTPSPCQVPLPTHCEVSLTSAAVNRTASVIYLPIPIDLPPSDEFNSRAWTASSEVMHTSSLSLSTITSLYLDLEVVLQDQLGATNAGVKLYILP